MAILERDDNSVTQSGRGTMKPSRRALFRRFLAARNRIKIINSTIGAFTVGHGAKGDGDVHITSGSSTLPPSAFEESASAAGSAGSRVWAHLKEWGGIISLPISGLLARVLPWPAWRLGIMIVWILTAIVAVAGVARTSRSSTADEPRPGARLRRGSVKVVTVLLLTIVLYSIRARAPRLPDGIERNDALIAAVSSAAKDAGYDRGPVNAVSAQVVDVGILRGSREIYLLVDIPWAKQEGSLVRNYRGTGLYRGTYSEHAGKVRIETLDLLDYSMAPTSPTLAYVIGLLEIDWMMSKQHVIHDPLLRALRELPPEKLAFLSR